MAIPKPSTLEKEGKTILGWGKRTLDYIQKRRKLIAFMFILILLFITLFGYLIYSDRVIFFFDDKGSLEFNASATFYFDRQVIKINDSYNGELSIQSMEKVPTAVNLYFIPYTNNKVPPIIKTEVNGCDFTQIHSCTLNFLVDTSFAQMGDFQICALIRDKSNQKRTYNYCNPSIISLS